MAIEVFNRREIKYIITNEEFEKINKEIQNYMELDEYNKDNKLYKIHNIYLDTVDDNLIRKSLSKPLYKEKVRIRSYKPFTSNDIVFLEIKKKYKEVVNKRRTKIRFDEALKFIETGFMPEYKEYMNKQVLKELEYIINKEKLYTKTYISYDRMAYFSKNERDLRVTFDNNIKSIRDNDNEISLLDSNLWIMEIKAEKSFPLWIVRLLSKYKVYKNSFSKYGNEYKFQLEKRLKSKSLSENLDNKETERRNENYAGVNLEYKCC